MEGVMGEDGNEPTCETGRLTNLDGSQHVFLAMGGRRALMTPEQARELAESLTVTAALVESGAPPGSKYPGKAK